MRFAYFDFNNNFGGAPQSMLHLAERLAAEHEVHIIDAYGRCQPYHHAIREAGLPCQVLMPDSRWTYIGRAGIRRKIAFLRQLPELLRLRARLVRAICAIDPDVVWVMNGKSLTFVALSLRLWRYPTALCVRQWATRDQVGRWLRWLIRYRVAAVLAVSTATLEQLRQAGVCEQKLHLGSTTVDMAKVQRLADEPLDGDLPGQELSPKILLLAARPERAKGHLTAVKALARLKAAGYTPALWLPGKPPVGADDSFIRELERLCVELAVEQNVFLLGWRDDIPKLIRACDYCILPSHTEGFPRSILEAMVLRRPVIATPVGGVRDAVRHGETGLLFPVDDDQSLADHIEELIRDPQRAERMASAAHEHVQRAFDPQEHTRRTVELFRAIALEDKSVTEDPKCSQQPTSAGR
jgi:glycosyltransferase involved in cell wall biosynthesis